LIAELQRAENRSALENSPLYDGRTFGKDNRIVLVCAGYVEGIGLSGSYPESLKAKAAELGVEVLWCGDRVKHSRGTENGGKIYSLWDAYTAADFVTYPSYWEGWGNQFIEAIFARLPVVLFEYPVYVSDLKPVGFEVVSLGSKLGPRDQRGLVQLSADVLQRAAPEVVTLLQDGERREEAVDRNFALAQRHFSYTALEGILKEIFAEHGVTWEGG